MRRRLVAGPIGHVSRYGSGSLIGKVNARMSSPSIRRREPSAFALSASGGFSGTVGVRGPRTLAMTKGGRDQSMM